MLKEHYFLLKFKNGKIYSKKKEQRCSKPYNVYLYEEAKSMLHFIHQFIYFWSYVSAVRFFSSGRWEYN